jgi:hypothetical protein
MKPAVGRGDREGGRERSELVDKFLEALFPLLSIYIKNPMARVFRAVTYIRVGIFFSPVAKRFQVIGGVLVSIGRERFLATRNKRKNREVLSGLPAFNMIQKRGI